MSFVGGLLSGSKGAGYQAQGPTKGQLRTSWEQTQDSIKQQKDFVNALQAQNGLANQSNVFQQQQGLADQFQNIASGQGPNPAMAALNQATGQNVSNQAALMAGQRGASANTGLIARQAAQQGGNLQQQAVGQGATMQAQQSLAALGQLQQQQGMMGNMANTQVSNQQGALSNLGQQNLGQQANLYGLQQNANSANANIAAQNAQSQAGLLGNVMGGIGSAIGLIPKLGGGGSSGGASGASAPPGMMVAAKGGEVPQTKGPKSKYGMMMANGGKVPALVSPGEVYLDPKDVSQVKQGANPLSAGEKIPGKAKVPGAKNDYANDTVPKTLEEGGIIIPRSVTQSKDAEKKAHEFISAILAKNKLKK